MSDNGAFEEDMSSDVKTFMESVRIELPEQLDRRFEADLIRRVAAQARVADAGRAKAPTSEMPARRRRLALPLRIAFATGALVLGMAGLAVAGVKLPGPVSSVFESVGVDLPNQSGGGASSESAEPSAPQSGEQPGQGEQGKAKSHGQGQGQGKNEPGSVAAEGRTDNGNHGAGSNGKSESAPGHTKSKAKPPRAHGKPKVQPPQPPQPTPPDRGNGKPD